MIEISIFKNSQDWANGKAVFRQRVEYGSILTPWDGLISSFKYLFGSNCIIEFVVL